MGLLEDETRLLQKSTSRWEEHTAKKSHAFCECREAGENRSFTSDWKISVYQQLDSNVLSEKNNKTRTSLLQRAPMSGVDKTIES